jgi:hypothetical protein
LTIQSHVHDEIEHVEFTLKAVDDDAIASVWFVFGEPVEARPGDRSAVVFWLRDEPQRKALRLALQQALDALDGDQ